MLDECRGLAWSRAIVPEDVVDVVNGRLIGLADYAQHNQATLQVSKLGILCITNLTTVFSPLDGQLEKLSKQMTVVMVKSRKFL